MKNKQLGIPRTLRLAGLAGAMLLTAAAAFADPPLIQQIIDYIDTNYEVRSDMTAQARITTKDPDQGTKVIESVYYRRDRDDAFLIVIPEPETDPGNGY